jgi:hypothetical protein
MLNENWRMKIAQSIKISKNRTTDKQHSDLSAMLIAELKELKIR